MIRLYVFSGKLNSEQFSDETGFFDKQGIKPSSLFEAAFKIDTENRYQPPNDHGHYMSANYVAGTLKNRFMGAGKLYDQVFQGEPGATLTTPNVTNRFFFTLHDLTTGFDNWKVGHKVQAHYEYRDGDKLSSFDTVLTLQAITPSP